MIIGIGTDICDITRFADDDTRARLMKRFYAPEECEYVASRGRAGADSAAGIFAAKEALAKALGTGFSGIAPEDICVTHDEKGAPHYKTEGRLREIMDKMGIDTLHLSISHDGNMAVAFCVAERTIDN